jgi:N-acetyl-anhydromuramyl-L-alanine amidase AmpD
MAWYPEAIKKVIAPGPNDPPIIAIGAILHIASSEQASLFNYFNGASGGIESHFYIRRDGTIEQYRDTAYEADANLKANQFLGADGKRYGYVSIETQGMDDGEWTPAQLASIKTLLRWLSEAHNFPLVKCKTPTSPGVGYHTLFGAPGPWTPRAKTCPGPDRIRQFNNELVRWMANENGEEYEVISDEDVTRIAQAVFEKIEPRLKAYTQDMKNYERQTDDDDAARAANATVKKLKDEGLTK